MDNEVNLEKALEIVTDKIVLLTKEYSTQKEEKNNNELKEKLELLKKIRIEVYKGNKEIINKVIKKNKRGVI